MPQIKTQLTNNNIDFGNAHFNRIHYRDGLLNIKKLEFQKRIFEQDYICVYINRDYKKSKKDARKNVIDVISKIYPNKDDRMYLLQTLGIALTGQSTISQAMSILRESVESTMMSIMKLAIQDYMLKLGRDTFTKGYSKIDKVMNSFKDKQYLRITFINELSDSKMSDSLFKDFIDGVWLTVDCPVSAKPRVCSRFFGSIFEITLKTVFLFNLLFFCSP